MPGNPLARVCVLALCLTVACGAVGASCWFLRLRRRVGVAGR